MQVDWTWREILRLKTTFCLGKICQPCSQTSCRISVQNCFQTSATLKCVDFNYKKSLAKTTIAKDCVELKSTHLMFSRLGNTTVKRGAASISQWDTTHCFIYYSVIKKWNCSTYIYYSNNNSIRTLHCVQTKEKYAFKNGFVTCAHWGWILSFTQFWK